MLVHEFDYLLAGALLDSLDTLEVLLEGDEIYLWLFSLFFVLVELLLLAECLQIERKVKVLRLELCRIHQL
jgi:hypothetical protein